jgi:hypothetical protein
MNFYQIMPQIFYEKKSQREGLFFFIALPYFFLMELTVESHHFEKHF